MPKVVYTSGKGLVQQAGSGITLESTPISTVQAKTAASTITVPGVYTVSGTAALSMTMPAAADVPGGLFVFRSLSTFAHFLTGSAEAEGTQVFKGIQSGSLVGQSQGSKLALAPIVGSSVALISDGKSFLVTAGSGSLAFSGT